MTYLISACLLGTPCRYDGQAKPVPTHIKALMEAHTLIPVCPEILGGLPTPRTPAERQGARVVTRAGEDVTEAYLRGAREVLRLCRLFRADGVILRDKSPACGTRGIYDGSFCRVLTVGEGVTAELLRREGIAVFSEEGPEAMGGETEKISFPPCNRAQK